jgi:hypothetical protein
MMTTDTKKHGEFDDVFGGLDDGGEFEDHFQAGSAGRYPKVQWFNGYLGVVDADGRPVRQGGAVLSALGFYLEEKKCEDDLIEALRILIKQEKAAKCIVEHGSGKQVVYYQLIDNDFFFLTHGTPSQEEVLNNPVKQYGLACGIDTQIQEDEKEHNTGGFTAVLGVSKQLYEAGYVGFDGLPKPLLFRFKGYPSGEFSAALRVHAEYVKFLRENGVQPKKAQFWAYSCRLGPSDRQKVHGKGNKSSKVFIIVNPADDRRIWSKDDEHFAGMELFLALRQMVAIPHGVAVQWCRAEIERGKDNQRKNNPGGVLSFGNGKLPDAYFQQKYGTAKNGRAVEEDSEEDHQRSILVNHKSEARKSGDQGWMKLIRLAEVALDDGDLNEVADLIKQSGKRRKEIMEQKAAVKDGFFADSE